MISRFHRLCAAFFLGFLFLVAPASQAVVRDGGVDPDNLGQGGWIYILRSATNHLAPSNVESVTNEMTMFKYLKSQGLNFVIVKAATSNQLWSVNGSNVPIGSPSAAFTTSLVKAAHANGLKIFASNRSWGNDIPGEIAVADYCFQQGADGFIYDAEAEWESSRAWIGTNGPALAWELCSTVRAHWPNKFIAHNPFDTAYLHFSFPFKEFGYWCDAVMPQVYHHSASKNNAIAAIHWMDWNYKKLHEYLASLSPTNINGETISWTNSIKPLVLMRDVYSGLSPNTPSHPDSDVRNFLDYLVADPNCVNPNGYNGSDCFRSEMHRPGQWANIKAATIGNFSNVVNNLVLDDARAAMTGDWTLVKTIDATANTVLFSGEISGDTNSFGTNYWRIGPGSGTNFMEFKPVILRAGNYDLYEWHPTRPDASASVPFVVNSSTGATTIAVNQQTNGGDWNLVGRFFFNAGTNASIKILDNIPEPGAVALVDGLKMVYVPVLAAAPGNLRATTAGSSSVNLSWKDNSTNEFGFIIARGTATGGPYFDVGSVSANATNFTDTNLTDSTIYYYVVRSRNYNIESSDSNEASALTLPGPPTIVTQPESQTVVEGHSATFQVDAVSSTGLTYQWKFNGEEIPGATESSFTIETVSAATDAGEYSVVLGNEIGSTTSAVAVLSVDFFLNATVYPEGAGTISISTRQGSFTNGEPATVIATANSGYTFVGWSVDAVSSSNPLSLPMTSSKNLVANFLYSGEIIVDNPDAVYSGIWTIGTGASEKFGSYYEYAAATIGAANAMARYTPDISVPGQYDVSIWYPAGANRTKRAQVLVSCNGNNFLSELDQTTGGGAWAVVAVAQDFIAGTNGFVSISNNTGEQDKVVVADAVRFSFYSPPVIFSQPQSQAASPSTDVTFQVLAGSSRPLSYQWQFNGDDIPGATASSYTRTNVQPNDTGYYNVIISNEADVTSSEAATLFVLSLEPPALNSVAISEGNGFRFSLSGNANVTYLIESSTNLVDWTLVTNLFSLDGNVEFSAPMMDGPARFYRARLQE